MLTNRVDTQLNPGTHDLVPLENGMYGRSRAIERPSPAEGVCKLCITCEVLIDGLFLSLRTTLAQDVHDAWNVFDWVLHFRADVERNAEVFT